MPGVAFGRENVFHEFTVIWTEIQNLQQAMHCIQEENRVLVWQNKSLRDYIEKTGCETHQKVEDLQRSFVASRAVAATQTLYRESNHHGDEVGVLENLPPKAKEEEEKAKQSKMAAKSNEIKVFKHIALQNVPNTD